MKSLATVSIVLSGMLVASAGCLDSSGQAVEGEGRDVTAGTAGEASQAGEASEGQLEATTVEDAEGSFEDVVARRCDGGNRMPNNVPVRNASGVSTTVSTHGFIDLDNEFFQDLGKNGRRCVSCHIPTEGWSITPHQLQATFEETDGGAYDDGLGLSAVFRTNDGSNSPKADVSTKAKRRQAYSMLLNKGLVRVGLPVPATAEFELVAVDDPYHFASANELSLFRRPLPTTNLKFDSTVMWDGREVVPGATVASELLTQANDATVGHAQGNAITAAQRQSIVDFELGLASAQIIDNKAGDLRMAGAEGGPAAIHAQPFYIGINDNFGDSKTGAAFSETVFTIFDRWANIGSDHDDDCDRNDHRHGYGHDRHGRDCNDHHRGYGYGQGNGRDRNNDRNEARRAIARGQAIFNSKKIVISGVSGINDEAAFGKPAALNGACSSCHNTPNGGNHSVVAPLNIGLTDASRRTADMPLYTLRNKTTGEIVKVTDPGRAMVDGKWSHIGRFKGPMLRNLAPRAPYFHNGFAKDLWSVVDFYDTRFHIGFTKQERSDLVAFLASL